MSSINAQAQRNSLIPNRNSQASSPSNERLKPSSIQGRRQKIFQGERQRKQRLKTSKKDRKIPLINLFLRGGG